MLDYPGTGGSYEYRVSAIDLVGNEQSTAAVNFDLLVGAVNNVQVLIENFKPPSYHRPLAMTHLLKTTVIGLSVHAYCQPTWQDRQDQYPAP